MLASRLTRISQLSSKLGLRSFASKSPLEEAHVQPVQLARTKDGSTIIAWHQKADFPYECTQPIPENLQVCTDTVLKTQMSPELMNIFNKKKPELARLELMNITHTTKHRWFPRARDKKAKKTPMERQYL